MDEEIKQVDAIREALQEQHPELVIELDKMVERVSVLEQRIRYAKEVYIGMDGFEVKTIVEGYCMQMMGQMYKELVGEK